MRVALAVAVLVLASVPGHASADDRSHKKAFEAYRAGQAALASERFPEAEQEFKKAIGLDPLLVAAHYGLGQTMMATKRYTEAVDALIAAREAFKQGQLEAASNQMATQQRLNDQIRALQDDVNSARRQGGGGGAGDSGNNAVQSAITRNEDMIRTLQNQRNRGGEGPLPTPHWLSFALGSAYFRAGDLAKAEQEYRAALEQKPDLGEAHRNLAVLCMMTGRLDEADSEIALAEKAGLKVPQGLKDDIQKRRQPQP